MFGLVLLALALRIFVVEAFKIPSAGMWPSLEAQDHIFVSKFARQPDYKNRQQPHLRIDLTK